MKIGALKERGANEARVAITPDSAIHLRKLGHTCLIEAGAGEAAGFSDANYRAAGCEILGDAVALVGGADVVVKVRPPNNAEADLLTPGKTLISFFYPAQNADLLERVRATGSNVIAMDMVPRISRAQKLDALSSMANVAGYRAVVEAANEFGRFFTGQVTAAGKVPPAKVLVIGAGVAGLAAIGAARSLGAVTYAFDVRPEVAEQIESMGAEFVRLDFASEVEDGASTGGYATPSSPEFREKQLAKFRELAPDVDIVVTTALIPGRDAPKLWLADMVAAMKRGSVVVDLAAERGGNCDLTIADRRIVADNGVIVIGYTDLPSRMAAQSSSLYATNIRHMLADLTLLKDGRLIHDMGDDVIRGATVAYEGVITYPPPAPKVQAIAARAAPKRPVERSPAEKQAEERAASRARTQHQVAILAVGAACVLLAGAYAPASFMAHLVVFVLACFVGFQLIWNVAHSLHTPLMAVTNAVSGIVVLGAILQVGSTNGIVVALAALAVLIATINVVGGFLVTRRMLAMFQKS